MRRKEPLAGKSDKPDNSAKPDNANKPGPTLLNYNKLTLILM